MYEWIKGESITAEKLNKTGQQLHMAAIDASPVGGGLDASTDPETWDDPGSFADPRRVEMAAHSLGAVTLEYNDSTDAWTPRGGAPGVTGMVEGSGGVLQWLTAAQKDGQVWQVWQRIDTNYLGYPTSCTILVQRTAPGTTRLWGNNSSGVVYRHLANVQWEAANCRWNIVNQDKALILPVARHYGWNVWECVNVDCDTDLSARKDAMHAVPVAGDTMGNTVPIRPLMEGGGTRLDAFACDGGFLGIGVSAGVEFYDACSVCSMNTDDPRPQGRTAVVDVYGKNLTIQPVGGHDCRPWQFLVTHDCGRFDPTGDGDWGSDPGSGMFAHDETMFGVFPRRPGLLRGVIGYTCCSEPWIDNDGFLHVHK